MKKNCKYDILRKNLTNLKINKNNEAEVVYKELLEDSLEGILKFSSLKETKPTG